MAFGFAYHTNSLHREEGNAFKGKSLIELAYLGRIFVVKFHLLHGRLVIRAVHITPLARAEGAIPDFCHSGLLAMPSFASGLLGLRQLGHATRSGFASLVHEPINPSKKEEPAHFRRRDIYEKPVFDLATGI
jgi:hypothetical protein